jgi:hypothetical protein
MTRAPKLPGLQGITFVVDTLPEASAPQDRRADAHARQVI